MSWIFINSGFQTGYYNMQFDVDLIEKSGNGQNFFRLYRWEPYCISLGAHQSINDIDTDKARCDNIDVVKRPTGGRAILHAEELTYSVALPLSTGLTPKEVYHKVSTALVNGLLQYHPSLIDVELQNKQPDFRGLLKQPEGKLCFASAAKSEIVYSGKKLVGSAQRKIGDKILQHGSILCGPYHKNLVNYLPEDEIHLSDLEEKTCDISTILNEPVDYDRLSECLKQGFQTEWEINFKKASDFATPQINS